MIHSIIEKGMNEFYKKFNLMLLDIAIEKGYEIKSYSTNLMHEGIRFIRGNRTYYFHNKDDLENTFLLFTQDEKVYFDPRSRPESYYTFRPNLNYSKHINPDELQVIIDGYERYKKGFKLCRNCENVFFRRIRNTEA